MEVTIHARKAELKTFEFFEVLEATDEIGNKVCVYSERGTTFKRRKVENESEKK